MPRWLGAIGLATLLHAPAFAQSPLDVARQRLRLGDVDSAYTLVRRLAVAESSNAQVQFWLGEIAGEKAARAGIPGGLGPARQSRRGYARAVALEPNNPSYLEGWAGYLSQAPGIVGGDRDSARIIAERLRQLDPVRGTFALASVHLRGGRDGRSRADSLVRRFAEVRPERPVLLRAGFYWLITGRPEPALPILERAVAADPADPVARYFLGRALLELRRDPGQAQRHLRYATQNTAPADSFVTYSDYGAWWRLGQAFVQLGHVDSARAAFEESLRRRPGFAAARRSLDSLSGR